jgi:hypothetical protein
MEVDKEEDDDDLNPATFFWRNPTLPNESQVQEYFDNPRLHRWCQKDFDDIITSIIDGGAVIFLARQGKQPSIPEDTQKHLAWLKDICWFTYSLEPKWNNGVVVFREKKINGVMPTWQLFKSYYDRTTDADHKNPVWFSTNGLSYARPSTHFRKSQANGKTQIGIDSRKAKNEWEEFDLPHGCSTMLCGELAENEEDNDPKRGRWFLKPEKDGLCGVAAAARHGKGVVGSVCRKVLPKVLGRNWGEWIAGSNDLDCHRKEHMPADIKEQYELICRKIKIEPIQVKSIAQLLEVMERDGLFTHHDAFMRLRESILSKYPHAQERFGNEVYLTDDELLAPSLYCWLAKQGHAQKDEAFALAQRNMELLAAIKGKSRKEEPGLYAILMKIQDKVENLTKQVMSEADGESQPLGDVQPFCVVQPERIAHLQALQSAMQMLQSGKALFNHEEEPEL